MQAKKIDHICIAVKDLAQAKKTYESVLGLQLHIEYVEEKEKIHVARYYLGDVALELMEATEPDSDVGRFIESRGEGVFLISYRVDDVVTGLAEMKVRGEEIIDKEPREFMGNRYAFIQPPRRMCGVLTEILDGEFDPDK
jgi:methylmalonyl-CoA/ethylmalonyl-CoA epimerase